MGVIYAINIIGWLAPAPIFIINIIFLITFVTNICVGTALFVMNGDYENKNNNNIRQTSNV